MKLKRFLFVVILAIICCFVATAQDVKKIAILETVDVEDNVKYGVELTVRSRMTTAITELEGYEAYDRVSMSQIMGEHNFQRTGYVSDTQIKQLGEMTGATYILICEVAFVDEANIVLVSKIIDIETTKVISNADIQSTSDGQSILEACRSLAKRLLKVDSSSSRSNTSNKVAPSQSSSTSSSQGQSKEISVNGVSFKMIYVAGGTFTMGANDIEACDWVEPVHSVTLSDYYIGETEVTQELWEVVMGTNPSSVTRSSRNPVEYVSWHDCQAFIQKLNQLTGLRFRLPTEAEWEYAARGGDKSKGYKYSGSNRIDDVAWYKVNSGSSTHEVATCYPNELGLYDMSGNVREWCSDWFGSYSSMAQTDPSGAGSGSDRVYRGGGWSSSARECRVAYRYMAPPNARYGSLGLRLVCSRL